MFFSHRWSDTTLCLFCLLMFGQFLPACRSCSSSDEKSSSILVFAAASLRDVMIDIGDAFEQAQGTKVHFNFAGSNTLALQIEAAPTADLFLSANTRWMDYVQNLDRIITTSRIDLLTNQLVVIAHPKHKHTAGLAPRELLSQGKIALGDPNAVPAGLYAKSWLLNQKLWEILQPRLIPTSDVRAALALVEADPDILGIVYRTDVIDHPNIQILLEVPLAQTTPIRYPVALIRKSPVHPESIAFLEFLQTPTARTLFERRGFAMSPLH